MQVFEVEKRRFVSINGPSGSGKSTLLNMKSDRYPASGGSLSKANYFGSERQSNDHASSRNHGLCISIVQPCSCTQCVWKHDFLYFLEKREWERWAQEWIDFLFPRLGSINGETIVPTNFQVDRDKGLPLPVLLWPSLLWWWPMNLLPTSIARMACKS